MSRYVRGYRGTGGGPKRTTPFEIDPGAVRRAADGDRSVRLAAIEMDLAIDQLDAGGMSAREVAIRLGVSPRTITRRRKARREQEQR